MNNIRKIRVSGFYVLLALIIGAPALYILGFISLGLAWLILALTAILGGFYYYLTTVNDNEEYQWEIETREDLKLNTKDLDISEMETIEATRTRKLRRY
jgi:fatty acid desaturase